MPGRLLAQLVDRNRDGEGRGFVQPGDTVRISSRGLGNLVHYVEESERCERWEFVIGSLMRHLASRSRP